MLFLGFQMLILDYQVILFSNFQIMLTTENKIVLLISEFQVLSFKESHIKLKSNYMIKVNLKTTNIFNLSLSGRVFFQNIRLYYLIDY